MRRVATADELFDILSSIKGGVKTTIGYVTGANLNLPEIKMKNPATNRMKGFHDYETFGRAIGEDGEVGGIVKLTSYSLNWQTPDSYKKGYVKYKQGFDALRDEFGIEPTERRGGYTKKQEFGDKGVTVYGGENDEISDHSYTRQNIYGAKIVSTYYLVDMEGHIVREMDKSELVDFLNTKRPEVSGVKALRDMGADDARIQDYIRREAELKFKSQVFETSHILYIVATANGEPLLWVNERLEHAVRKIDKVLNGVDVIPAEFTRIAKERYSKEIQDIQESVNMRLNANDIRYIVEETTRRILRETTEGGGPFEEACNMLLNMGTIEYSDDEGPESTISDEEMQIIEQGEYPIIWTIGIRERNFRSPNYFESIEDAEEDCEKVLQEINFYELAKMSENSIANLDDFDSLDYDTFMNLEEPVYAGVGGLGYFEDYHGNRQLEYEGELSNLGFGFYD